MNQNAKRKPAPARPTNNIEFVTDLMEFSKFGPVAQIFVIDALDKVAHMIAATPPEELAEKMKGTPFISAAAWQGVAQEIAQKLDERLGK